MPKTEWNRKLDLSAAKSEAKASPKPKTRHPAGLLSDRQGAAYQRAVALQQRWLTRLKRATNAVKKHQKTIRYYEKLLAKNVEE